MKKLLRQTLPDPQQLALQLDFFSRDVSSDPAIEGPASGPAVGPEPGIHQSVYPAGVAAPLAQGRRRVQLKDYVLDYTLMRSKRRSIGFVIEEEGLRVTAPRWVTVGEIESGIREKQRWILTKLNERREYSARRMQPQMQWRHGATLPYLGNDITLHIVTAQSSGISYDPAAQALTISLPPDASEQQLKDRVQGWLQTEAKRLFAERLPIYAEKLGVRYHSFALSSAMTQWGSCTVDGKIRLNWRLMHFALPQIDYVIAHELAHLREMNHSPRFWAAVQSIFPEFEAAKKALRQRGPETLPAF